MVAAAVTIHSKVKIDTIGDPSRFPAIPRDTRLARRDQIRDGNLERGGDSFHRLQCWAMFRGLDAREVCANHSGRARQLLLRDPFLFTQFSNRSSYFLTFLRSSRTTPEVRVRWFGLVKNAIPWDFVTVAGALGHVKEKPLAVDSYAHQLAAVIGLQRGTWETVLFTALKRDDEVILSN